MSTTLEDRELEYELTLDAASTGHTDHVQAIAEQAIDAALARFEHGEAGDLMLNAARAALIAATAALRALDAEGHLVPEGASVAQMFVVMSDDEKPLTVPMTAEELGKYMADTGLPDTARVDSIRTVITPIPREATRPAPPVLSALPADDFDF